ncbi:MAG TPA: AMP-binding protein [Actinomycetes bacterium]|nr:AMP-binding protein [Actinomycetes bacterium]
MNSKVRYHRRRLADTAAALRLARTQVSCEQGPRAQLASHQQQRLETVVRHAATHSPFYRRWFAQTGALGEEPVELQRLPVLDKSLLMEHFDELVCDPRLRRDSLLGWVGQLTRDQLYLDRYRVALTSGSSGRPGLFVYDAAGWRAIAAQLLRSSSWAGLRPSLPRQRVAWLGGAAPTHISRQGAATLAIGLHRVLALPVTLPLPQLVEALNQFQPTYLNVYPSVAMWLAAEQQAGRLRLAPQMLVTAAELRTPEMTQRLIDAFGVRPFDVYGSTEGLFGSECQHHQGIHLFEDTTLVENVDPDGQPVPAGQPGARLLVTNLYNLVQPLLRLEVTDLVTLDPDPCPCGRTLVRVSTIHGRSDDVLSLAARDGGRVAVHPLHFALLTRDPQVREFQVVQDGPALRILIVLGQAATASDNRLETRLGQAVAHHLLGLGVHDPQITVERRQELPRSAGGKLKLVIADPATRPADAVAR